MSSVDNFFKMQRKELEDETLYVDEKPRKVRIVRVTNSPESIWRECVNEAKLLVTRRADAKLRICQLAAKVCEIKHGGGGHWNDFKDQKSTLSSFAKAIGLHPKTLIEWFVVKKEIYDTLPTKQQDEFNWTVANRTRRINLDARKNKEKLTTYSEEIKNIKNKKANLDFNIEKYFKTINSVIVKADKEQRKKIVELCKKIIHEIESNYNLKN